LLVSEALKTYSEYAEAIACYEQGIHLLKEVDYTWGVAIGYQFLGNIALLENRLQDTLFCFRNALSTMYKNNNTFDLIGVLLSIPGLLLAQGKKQQAVELTSLLLNYPNQRKAYIGERSTRATINRILPQLKSELGEEPYSVAWEHGKSLDIETVVKALLVEFGDNPA
jgi:tetratricopeptide (TPR) repeat protein